MYQINDTYAVLQQKRQRQESKVSLTTSDAVPVWTDSVWHLPDVTVIVPPQAGSVEIGGENVGEPSDGRDQSS